MSRPTLTPAQVGWDAVLAGCCLAVAVPIQLAGVDSVPANRPVNAWSVILTVAAIAPLVLRRRAPVAVLAACFPGFLGLIAGHYSVGAAPIGALIAFYTAVAWDSRPNTRLAVVVVVLGYGVGIALRPIDLSVEGSLVQLALLIGGWIVGTGTRQRRELHATQVAQAERRIVHERERAGFERERAENAAVQERLRISRELHDILGHAFSVMVVQAGVAEHLIDRSPADARRALAELSGTGRASLTEIRRLLQVLRSGDDGSELSHDPAPTLADLPALVARVEAAGLPVALEVSGPPMPWTPGVELAAYRVIQEGLTNCLKHSGAGRATVSLTHTPGELTVEVHDDGPPAPAGPAPHQGHGLAGMRERVAMYGGQLSAGPVDSGYRIRATFPGGQR